MFNRLESLLDRLFFGVLNLDSELHWVESLHFFVYDTIKIFILLFVIVHFMTLINHYLPVPKIRKFLTSRKWYGLDHLLASIFGTVTPFCSCSSIPLFIGFLKGGIPLGVTLSFLITSPLVNEVAVALFLGIFGLKITAIYVVSGVVVGTLGGWILGKFKLERFVESYIRQPDLSPRKPACACSNVNTKPSLSWKKISNDSFKIIKKVFPFVVIGVAIGAVIHGFVPANYFETYLSKGNWFAVPLAVIVGIPMYTNASGVIPVVQSLIAKGVPLGTGLAFMMSVVGLSLPEFLILKKVMKMKLLLLFFGIVGVCIILLGFGFNWFL